ncbi:hypothetical protein PN836_004425 [Ningiella sp. W23]|uniref:hypothetical protein n=1 Tax=Ningiella sp. W23 TaxID=3023715 RepID=UPI0037576948
MKIEVPKDYRQEKSWWVCTTSKMPDTSVLPDPKTPGAWIMKKFEPEHFYDIINHVQGWKLHVNVMPLESEPLFRLLSPLLNNFQVFHKFLPFNLAWNQDISKENFNKVSRSHNAGEGKNCVIYPEDPEHLSLIVKLIDQSVFDYRQKYAAYQISKGLPVRPVLAPFPGGTKGNIPVGNSCLVSTRYGGFTNTGRRRRLYNNAEDKYVPDYAYGKPFPAFARNIPTPIRALF